MGVIIVAVLLSSKVPSTHLPNHNDSRWDFASGQFSWSQDDGLLRAIKTVERRALLVPDAVICPMRFPKIFVLACSDVLQP